MQAPTQPVSAEALRTLHVATVLLAHKLETGDPGTGEWAALNALWGQNSHGLSLHLLTVLDALAADAPYALLAHPATASYLPCIVRLSPGWRK